MQLHFTLELLPSIQQLLLDKLSETAARFTLWSRTAPVLVVLDAMRGG
jgi:hypothetical protein